MNAELESEILSRLKKLEEMLLQNVLLQKAVLNIEEAALYLKLKVSYLYKLTSKRLIPHFKASGKVLSFDRVALDEWRRRNPVATQQEINSLAGSKMMEKK